MKQITIRVDPDLLAAISERQSMAIVKQPRRTFAGERQAEAFIADPDLLAATPPRPKKHARYGALGVEKRGLTVPGPWRLRTTNRNAE